MSRTVVVVDHGSGNLRSVSQAVMHVAQGSGLEVLISNRAEDVFAAERVVLPGQGAFYDCMQGVEASGLTEAVLDAATNKPLMGVCVGMQMLLERSEEGPAVGLGLFAGDVLKFQLQGQLQPDGSRYKVPQMGWNQVMQAQPHPMWADVPDGAYFYFLHSFYAKPSDARHSVGETDYGGRFTSVLARDNIFATQFHPEKSAAHGLALYRNFLHWNP